MTSSTRSVADAGVATAAARLQGAARTRTPCAPVRDLIGTVGAAYAVQQHLGAARLADGAAVVGRKIGLTSPAVQQQLGVDQPDFGVLFDDMACAEDEPVDTTRLLQPRIEAEIAFVLSRDITDPDADAAGVGACVEYALASLEIVDSRVAGWDITLVDTVADNASSGLFVLGARRVTPAEAAPVDARMTMSLDGELVSAGDGRACLGDPVNALAWLARTAVAVGDPLRAGQVVLSGALGPMVAVRPGVHVRADIGVFGTVQAHFSPRSTT